MSSDGQIPKYVFEVQLFQRRLASTLRIEQERVNKLLREQIELLERRKELLCDLHRAVLDQWNEELNPAPELAVAPASETPSCEPK